MAHFDLILILVFLGVSGSSCRNLVKRSQNPKVWDALDKLKGKSLGLTVDQIQELFMSVKPGEDFPILFNIPAANVDCNVVKPGFYANDNAGRCQSFDRCDVNGNLTSYLCPNMTLFNQITFICDWWYNVDCEQARTFFDYSNANLYKENAVFLEDQTTISEYTGAVKIVVPKTSGKRKSKKKDP